jgi:hypothetical protein
MTNFDIAVRKQRLVGAVNVNSAIPWIFKENADWEDFKYLACGTGPNGAKNSTTE